MLVTEAALIDRLLGVARETIATVRHCWLATAAPDGGANARAVRAFPGGVGADEWARRFLCRRGSRKVPEIQRAPGVTLAYQDGPGDRYVGLVGRAGVIDDRTEMRTIWQGDWDAFFPPGYVIDLATGAIFEFALPATNLPPGVSRGRWEKGDTGPWTSVIIVADLRPLARQPFGDHGAIARNF